MRCEEEKEVRVKEEWWWPIRAKSKRILLLTWLCILYGDIRSNAASDRTISGQNDVVSHAHLLSIMR